MLAPLAACLLVAAAFAGLPPRSSLPVQLLLSAALVSVPMPLRLLLAACSVLPACAIPAAAGPV